MQFSDAPVPRTAAAPETDLERLAAAYTYIRNRVEPQTAELNRLKKQLSAMTQQIGVRDENGSYTVALQRSYDVGDKRVSGLKWQRSVTRIADEEAAERIAKKKKCTGRLFPRQPVFDPQEVYVLFQEGRLTEEEVDEIFPEKETFSFVLVKEQ
ncbi:hypothetical protein AB0B15_03345 [Streptomyces sp. NPDC045456]|uniref:hypothetical protein n=1 Tax=Streptomyces sp. NPDC045456 TaxID=3155254 RepID=UPI0033D4375E